MVILRGWVFLMSEVPLYLMLFLSKRGERDASVPPVGIQTFGEEQHVCLPSVPHVVPLQTFFSLPTNTRLSHLWVSGHYRATSLIRYCNRA
jgi:hypothetical protein